MDDKELLEEIDERTEYRRLHKFLLEANALAERMRKSPDFKNINVGCPCCKEKTNGSN